MQKETRVRFLKNPEEDYNINLPSMTDIVFLLLIFFMVATVLKDSSRRLDLQLPESRSGEVSASRRFIIEMALDSAITLNGEMVTLERLEAQLRSATAAGEQRSVLIMADKGLPYGKVVEVMGLCQAVGVSDIAVAVK